MKKIAVKNFFRPFGLKPRPSDLYESDLGWEQVDYDEAMASTPEEVLRYYLDVIGYDFYFFYPKTLRWYWLDNASSSEGIKLILLRPKEDWDGIFLEGTMASPKFPIRPDNPGMIFMSDSVEEFLKGAAIDGVPISEVMNRSWIKFS